MLRLEADLPPWITRLRMWDSYGTYVPIKTTTGQPPPPPPPPVASSPDGGKTTTVDQTNYGNYYYSPQNPKLGKNLRVNIDNAWNPVDTYVYGPTQSSIFNQENKYSGYQMGGGGKQPSGNGISSVKDTLNYISSKNFKETAHVGAGGSGGSGVGEKNPIALMSTKGKRRLMLEIYDYETPKLCDHTAVSNHGNTIGYNRLRPCSPLESYVSSGRDLYHISLIFTVSRQYIEKFKPFGVKSKDWDWEDNVMLL
ncbi:hypothetical protein GQX74_012763 [Glossina fuscipes]|nr:hypothetical protein GQX74_012763 [Glossina fuscipes]